jgi:uncharacterized protein YndB with AHSA1/START domain
MTAKTTILTRLSDAPRELVFECWLKPEHLLHWYSAGGGWTTPYAETDPKTGGRFKIGFAAPDGKGSFDFTGTYSEEQQRHGWGAMLENLNTYLERKAA